MTAPPRSQERPTTRRDVRRVGRAARRSVRINRLLPILMVFVGVGVFLYPVLATQLNNRDHQAAARDYSATVHEASAAALGDALASARSYNSGIDGIPILDPWLTKVSTNPTSTQYRSYVGQLAGLSAMARLHVPSVGIDLPVYHGTSEETLARGVGHLYGTSLPVGGTGTHAVLTSHTGLSSATLFDHLHEVKLGDRVQVDVFGETLIYEVDQIKVVLPEEPGDLVPVQGEDLLTLMTCTPYGVNTHRLLVRAHRVALDDSTTAAPIAEAGPAWAMESWMWWLLGGAASGVVVIGIIELDRRRRARVTG